MIALSHDVRQLPSRGAARDMNDAPSATGSRIAFTLLGHMRGSADPTETSIIYRAVPTRIRLKSKVAGRMDRPVKPCGGSSCGTATAVDVDTGTMNENWIPLCGAVAVAGIYGQHIRTRVRARSHDRAHVCTDACKHVHTHVRACVCTHNIVHTSAHISAHMRACISAHRSYAYACTGKI